MYGGVEEFQLKSIPFGVQVYKFANEMQIDSLTNELTNLFKQPSPLDVFAIFDLYCIFDNQPGLEICRKVCAIFNFYFELRSLI